LKPQENDCFVAPKQRVHSRPHPASVCQFKRLHSVSQQVNSQDFRTETKPFGLNRTNKTIE